MTTNRELHFKSALERIEKHLIYHTLHDCDAIDKLRGLPKEVYLKKIRLIVYE